RTKALADFKAGNVRVLVATDIAARGIDIDQLPHVVNFELPNVPEDYVHRIGRTGRAGMSGEAVSLVCVDEHELLRAIERFTKSSIKKVDLEAFRPDPSIEAEPIQNGRGGGKRSGGQRSNGNRSSGRNTNRNKKPAKNQPNNEKTPTEKKKKPRNPHAEKIGSNLQAKLDKLDKKQKPQSDKKRRR
ncbi:MAG TPA: ATP-dependent RNA helicase RhlE, partial [Sulfurovum sp.]|nr:ATP-dependent RNA helicase RhlE [Sulfurovum sp.]